MISEETFSVPKTTLSVLNIDIDNSNETSPQTRLTEDEIFYEFSKWFNVILSTILTIFGIYGNVISTKIFLGKHYKQIPIKTYLIMLSLSDLFVLITHYVDFTLRAWVNLFGIYSSKFNFVDKCFLCCKLVSYLRNVFRTMSVYVLLLMTFQRFIILYFPLIRAKWCSLKFNKRLILILFIISFSFNSSSLFIVDLVKHSVNGETFCNVKEHYIFLQFYIELLFVIFTILIPSIFIIILSVILLYKIKSKVSLYKFSICLCSDMRLKEGNNNVNKNRSLSLFPKENFTNFSNSKIFFKKSNVRFQTSSLKCVSTKESLKSSNTVNLISSQNRKISLVNLEKKKSKSDSFIYNTKLFDYYNLPMKSIDTFLQKLSKEKEVNKLAKKESLITGRKKAGGHSIRTTYVLVLVSKWFVLLHLPYFVCWVIFRMHMGKQNELLKTIQNNEQFNATANNNQSVYEMYYNFKIKTNIIRGFVNIFEVLFLLNYSIHFLLYIVNGPLFRKRFCKKMMRALKRIRAFLCYVF